MRFNTGAMDETQQMQRYFYILKKKIFGLFIVRRLCSWLTKTGMLGLIAGSSSISDAASCAINSARAVNLLTEGDERLLDLLANGPRAEAFMLPISEVVKIKDNVSLTDDLLMELAKMPNGYSTILVASAYSDLIVGYVNFSDLFVISRLGFSIDRCLRKVVMIHRAHGVYDLIKRMMESRVELVVIVDEYRCPEGIIDVSMIPAFIWSHCYDSAASWVGIPISNEIAKNKTIEVSGKTPVVALSRYFSFDFDKKNGPEDIDTVGGLVFDFCGYIPRSGEIFYFGDNFVFVVKEATERRIKHVIVHKIEH